MRRPPRRSTRGRRRSSRESERARRMGTTQLAIARIESGRTVPAGATRLKFAKAVRRSLRVQFR